MADHDIHDISPGFTPKFNNGKEGLELNRMILQSPNPSLLASTIAFAMLRQLATQSSGNSLTSMLATERAGGGPNVEGFLKQILSMKGISVDPDILYGKSIPQDMRQQWQRVGIDPDSENEVFEFLSQKNIKFLTPNDDIQGNAKRLREYAKEHGLVPQAASPSAAPPKPTKP